MSKKFKVGIIGLGVGEQHVAGFHKHPDCEVVALCDTSEEKLKEVGARHPGMRLTTRDRDLLEDPSLNILSIATYDNFHHEQIVAGIENGKHLFVEKPLCLHEKEAIDVRARLLKKPELKISSNLILRASPRFQNLKARIDSKAMGELFHIEGDYNYGRIHKLHSGWRGEIEGYSVTLGGGLHLIDLVLWLTGERVVEVSAVGNAISSRGSLFKQNDTVVALLKFENGMTGKVGANFACVYPHFHKLTVYGTNATFENGLQHGSFFTSRDAQKSPEILTDAYPGVHKGDLIYSFVESILGTAPAVVQPEDVFSALSVAFAIERSVREKSTIKVAYI